MTDTLISLLRARSPELVRSDVCSTMGRVQLGGLRENGGRCPGSRLVRRAGNQVAKLQPTRAQNLLDDCRGRATSADYPLSVRTAGLAGSGSCRDCQQARSYAGSRDLRSLDCQVK